MDNRAMLGGKDPELNHSSTDEDNDAHFIRLQQQHRAEISGANVKMENTGSISKLAFRVDAARIQSVPRSEQNSELQNLGLQVYNQEVFEQGVLAQVDEEIAEQERQQAIHLLKRELTDIDTDIKLCEEELQRTEKVWSMMQAEKFLSREGVRQMHSVKSRKENKLRQLKTLNVRKQCSTQRLNVLIGETSASTNDASSSQKLDNLLGLADPSRPETESDRMIRLGEMTPFETLMLSRQKSESVGAPTPSTSQMSDFDKFLLDQEKRTALNNKGRRVINQVTENHSKHAGVDVNAKRVESDRKVLDTKKKKVPTATLR